MNKTVALWAVDHHERDVVPSFGALRFLWNFRVLPISILKEDSSEEQESLNNYLSQCTPQKLEAVRVLTSEEPKNPPAAKFLDVVNELQANLIVLTCHGRSRNSLKPYGSFADYLLKHSKTPILFMTTYSELPTESTNRALFLYQGDENSKVSIFTFLAQTETYASELILFQTQAHTDAIDLIQSLRKRYPNTTFRLMSAMPGKSTEDAIRETCDREKVDLVALTQTEIGKTLFNPQNFLIWIKPSC